MDLYCKTGDGTYEKLGEMREGIWLVSEIKDGRRYSLLLERSEDVPKAMIRGEITPYMDKIEKKMRIFLDQLWMEFLNSKDLNTIPDTKTISETLITEICNILPARRIKRRKKK